MPDDMRPFHSALEYLVSLSQVAAARRTVGCCCHPDGGCGAVCEAHRLLRLHREREQLSLESQLPHERGPFGLADQCGMHVLEIRILAYLFLSEGTVPNVPVFLNQEEMLRYIAEGREASLMRDMLEADELLAASGCLLRIQVDGCRMVALTERGREALVNGDLCDARHRAQARHQLPLPFARNDGLET